MDVSNLKLGVGLKSQHFSEVLTQYPPLDWFEVHSENYFYPTPAFHKLLKVREHYPISLHGVGLSLGSQDFDTKHIKPLKQLIEQIEPFLISEHLSWSKVGPLYLPDLLPVPYTQECLANMIKNVNVTQEILGRTLLLENPSSYLQYKCSYLEEVHFLIELCQQTEANILLDVNNIYVSCQNHGWDPNAYIKAIPTNLVREIHLAGHSHKKLSNGHEVKIDTHDNSVCNEVWALYKLAISRFGLQPTLLEWDANIPKLSVLIEEVQKAKSVLTSNIELSNDISC